MAVKTVKKKSKTTSNSLNPNQLEKLNQAGGGKQTVRKRANFGKIMVRKGSKNGKLLFNFRRN
jgi:hypothetical protein